MSSIEQTVPQLRIYATDDHFHAQRATTPGHGFVEVRQWPADIVGISLAVVGAHVSAALLEAFRTSPAEGARQTALLATNYQELLRELVGEAASWACATAATASDARDKGER